MTQQNSIEIFAITFTAGESKLFNLSGEYFEIIDAPSPVDVVLSDVNGSQRARLIGAKASFYSKNVSYGQIQITSATAQTIAIAYGSGETGTRRSVGSVTVANVRGPFTQAQASVTNASTQLVAPNGNRSYLLIQNKSTMGYVYLNLSGAAATVGNGLSIEPLGSFELSAYKNTNAITAIGSIANNPDVVVVEG